MSEKLNPMEQFAVHEYFKLDLFGLNICFTNSSLIMLSSAFVILIIFYLAFRKKSAIPSKFQLFVEIVYNFALSISRNALSEERKYDAFVISIFFFILGLNIAGMIFFAPTSHMSVTISMGLIVFFLCIAISIKHHGFKFFSIFIPKGVAKPIIPLIFIIELFSYIAKPISLGVRLMANVIAGHVMMFVIGSFIVMMGMFGILPMFTVIGLSMVECCVMILQAYIFAILSATYIGEALHH